MSQGDQVRPGDDHCWSRIGTTGDRTCPELEAHVHCRNCPVYADGARRFFDRPAPEGYLAEWSRLLAAPVAPTDSKDLSLLIFRLGGECLALPTRVVDEVTAPRPVHRVPHRSDARLLGLVNLRGRLQLQVSLHAVIGVEGGEAPGPKTRLVVIGREGLHWVFAADEVFVVQRFSEERLGALPSTHANPANSFSRALVTWRGRTVGLLDDPRVFAALKGVTS